MLSSFSGQVDARKSLLSGDYEADTVSVSQSLQEIITSSDTTQDDQSIEENAVPLIYEYISRYRPRGDVNGRNSYTTMQTALNSLAGHYKTFPNRPLPEKLVDRVQQELSKAERSLASGD